MLRDNALIGERWVRCFEKMLNTKPSTLDSSIVDELKKWSPCRQQGDVPSRYEVEEVIRALANRKAVGPDGLLAELVCGRRRRIGYARNVPPYHRRCVEGRWRAATMERCND